MMFKNLIKPCEYISLNYFVSSWFTWPQDWQNVYSKNKQAIFFLTFQT